MLQPLLLGADSCAKATAQWSAACRGPRVPAPYAAHIRPLCRSSPGVGSQHAPCALCLAPCQRHPVHERSECGRCFNPRIAGKSQPLKWSHNPGIRGLVVFHVLAPPSPICFSRKIPLASSPRSAASCAKLPPQCLALAVVGWPCTPPGHANMLELCPLHPTGLELLHPWAQGSPAQLPLGE